jgi:transposase
VEEEHLGAGKKNAKKHHSWIVFLDESGVSQKPPVSRIWAPRGRTPVLRHCFNWKKLSICSALGFSSSGRCTRLIFQIVPNSFNDEKLIVFLSEMRAEFKGKKVILVWDGLPSHRSRLMTNYLKGQRSWLNVTRLPAYAPDLNPVEYIWANIKRKELANLCSDDLTLMVDGVRNGFSRIHESNHLHYSFLKHAGLSLGGAVH